VDHLEAALTYLLLVHSLSLEFHFNLVTLLHEKIKKLFRLLLHVFFIFVNENRLHDELIEPIEVLNAACRAVTGALPLLVGVKHLLVAAVRPIKVD
jgi:hypothetical protein